ncbi:MAG: hypothetical protein K9M54_08165 [Kiritimatiellales bacterium]|nr:hypothetical protein [Kiritimatiellales bacterium]MCF7864722.1 hypothetical protein [Kiritimatiellales bacterium]
MAGIFLVHDPFGCLRRSGAPTALRTGSPVAGNATRASHLRTSIRKNKNPAGMAGLINRKRSRVDYLAFAASAFLAAQVSQVFSAVHLSHDLAAGHAEHAAFVSAFLSLHPQVSHANAAEPATNRAIAAILIILFITWSPLCCFNQLPINDLMNRFTFKTVAEKFALSRVT